MDPEDISVFNHGKTHFPQLENLLSQFPLHFPYLENCKYVDRGYFEGA